MATTADRGLDQGGETSSQQSVHRIGQSTRVCFSSLEESGTRASQLDLFIDPFKESLSPGQFLHLFESRVARLMDEYFNWGLVNQHDLLDYLVRGCSTGMSTGSSPYLFSLKTKLGASTG